MSETLYCYCCRVHHPRSEMRRFPTRQGERWRCLRSIKAARHNRDQRDAFGRQTTTLNRLATEEMAERVNLLNLDTHRP